MKAEVNTQCSEAFDIVETQFLLREIKIVAERIIYPNGETKIFLDGDKEDVIAFVFSLGFYTGKQFNDKIQQHEK